jgi:prepilin signal peptidase PulO-like enzyme (type II secretory pathway)
MLRPLILLSGFAVFASILLAMEIGRRFGERDQKQHPDDPASGTGSVEAAVFGLLGLLVAFTFSGAGSRFDARRQLIVEESNTIGTAYLRVDLLPAQVQPSLRDKFRQYVDARLETYRKIPDLAAVAAERRRAETLQGEIWAQAVAACKAITSPAVTTLVLNSLNQMIDISTTRNEGAQMHPPAVIYVMLVALLLACSVLAGNAMSAHKVRNWVHILTFTITLSLALIIIIDFDYPRIGWIRIDDWDRVLVGLRASMS